MSDKKSDGGKWERVKGLLQSARSVAQTPPSAKATQQAVTSGSTTTVMNTSLTSSSLDEYRKKLLAMQNSGTWLGGARQAAGSVSQNIYSNGISGSYTTSIWTDAHPSPAVYRAQYRLRPIPVCLNPKAATIAGNIAAKLRPLRQSGLDPEALIFAGGFVRRLTDHHELISDGDIDVWTPHEDMSRNYARTLAQTGWKVAYVSKKNLYEATLQGFPTVQIINHSFHSDPDTLLQDFDFSICQAYATLEDLSHGRVMYDEQGLEDLKNRTLRVRTIRSIKGFLKRQAKYVGYGFYIPEDHMTEVAEGLNTVNPINNPADYLDG